MSHIPTYKIVGDNLDKYVRPRHERTDRHSSSLHYFHSFAVKDRCDMSNIPDNLCPDLTSFSIDDILPTTADYNTLVENYTIIAARVIPKHIPSFKGNVKRVVHHILHSSSCEMSQKSEVGSVMSHLQQYVPTNANEDEVNNPLTDESFKVFSDKFHYILFGGIS